MRKKSALEKKSAIYFPFGYSGHRSSLQIRSVLDIHKCSNVALTQQINNVARCFSQLRTHPTKQDANVFEGLRPTDCT